MYFMVVMIESEAGWGQRVDDVLYFARYEVASEFVEKYNKKWNVHDSTPDWYLQAEDPKPIKGIPEGKRVLNSVEEAGYVLN